MTDETNILRDRLVRAALPHVPFDGWSRAALDAGARDAGLTNVDVLRAFPGGPIEAIEHYATLADRAMLEDLERRDLKALRVRERVALAVRVRLERASGDREAIRRALGQLALPVHAPLALKTLYRTVDAIWWAAGDTSTDYNFYTKRALLAAVYSATLLYWLDDRSEGSAASWAFLDRRLADVMKVPQLAGRARAAAAAFAERLPNPLRFFRRA
jgi:ubiquinone biosynthesis protein COQ9